MKETINQLHKYIEKSHRITVITGAGISTSAGIPDFRGPGGLYSRKDINTDKIFDINYFRTNPDYFYSVMTDFFEICINSVPTTAHKFIYQLEKNGKLELLITQNIDGLHEKAGNRKIVRAHGSLDTMICTRCKDLSPADGYFPLNSIPHCRKCSGVLKPDVVFFGENVKGMDEAVAAVSKSDLLLAIGTSFSVFPVASLPMYKKSGCIFVIINKGKTGYDSRINLKIEDDIDGVCGALLE
ncbi:MAG: Sir2 family NAD-dependent protein deacetylase [Spirochaetes bacterium]|nr:Sir2 family NAD-dependent protein deacetylase [Spirochaetota bacterium]